MFRKSAYDVWKEEIEAGSIVTLCKDLDDAIGGGIRIGAITELVSGPGSGRTQICLQLCVNVQIPKNLRGLERAAVYIDTNRGFSVERAKEIATATKNHCENIYRADGVSFLPSAFSVDSILNNIHCCICNNYLELIAAIYRLRSQLERQRNVGLIVVDSFSYLFRSVDPDVNVVQLTYEILSKLQQIGEEFRCAIVITNELTTRATTEGNTYIVPALGESHSHRVNHQITIGRNDNDPRLFIVHVDKCFVKAETQVPFLITTGGLRPYKKRVREPDEYQE